MKEEVVKAAIGDTTLGLGFEERIPRSRFASA
jgi:hypothetical protein